MIYGLLDTEANTWFGDDKGPLTYDDEDIAKVAALVVDVRLRQKPGR